KKFAKLGARVPKGLLLYGPPGTGKTLLAKAVAHESGASFYSQSASAFVEMFAGLGASRIRKLFATARKNAPSIIFIDELDAVGAARTGHGFNREQDQTLNQLLVELDGFEGADQVVVMAAANRSQALGYTLNLPMEDRYLHTKEELVDMMTVYLAGRAAEQVVFGRVTNGAANDLEKATGLARSMIFEYGMGDAVSSRTMRADNYAL